MVVSAAPMSPLAFFQLCQMSERGTEEGKIISRAPHCRLSTMDKPNDRQRRRKVAFCRATDRQWRFLPAHPTNASSFRNCPHATGDAQICFGLPRKRGLSPPPTEPAASLVLARCRGDSSTLTALSLSIYIQGMMEVCLWPRGDYILEHHLPHCIPLVEPEVVLQLVQELAPMRPNEVIDSDTWYSSCRYLDIPWESASLIYANCTSVSQQPRACELCLDLYLLSLSARQSGAVSSRDDSIASFFHNSMVTVLKILLLDPAGAIRDEHLSALDYVFEGMIDCRPESASRIARLIWGKEIEQGVRRLAKRFSECLIPDPFRLCNLVGKESKSRGLRKRTSLAPHGRRMVSVSGWRRLQLLTKHIYRGAHFRLHNSLAKPSPIYALSYGCPCLLLGPCKGTVQLRNLKDCTITVACRRIFMENVEDCTIFLSSQIPAVVQDCRDLKFAPYNAAYSGLWEELQAANLKLPGSFHPEDKDASWNMLTESNFYVQPVPTVCEETDYQELLKIFPQKYVPAAQKSIRCLNDEEENGLRASDIFYLKTKIE